MDSNNNVVPPSTPSMVLSPDENAVRGVLIGEKINTIAILQSLKIISKETSRFSIILSCFMISRLILHPTLQIYVNKLEVDFVSGYRDWKKAFHVCEP